MNNPFQEQLLKAGIVSEQQVKKAQQDKKNKRKQQPKGKKSRAQPSEADLRARQARDEKANRDRELNQRKQQQARAKAISAEIDQMIREHRIARDDKCEIAYNFEHQGKVKSIYLNSDMRQKVIDGKLGIARIEGRYELVPLDVAQKIRDRNEKRVVILEAEQQEVDENDPYADYQVPDDLMW